MRVVLLVISLCLALNFCLWATVDLSEIGVGARPLSLGNTFSGGFDDASSIFTNPAGLGLTSGFKAVSMSGTLLSDVKYVLVGAANTSPIGKVAIGYVNASVPSIPLTTVEGTGANLQITQTGLTDYSSSIIFFSYATRLGRIFRGKGNNLLFGANLKLFLQGFSGGGAVMQNANGAGLDADIGLIWQASSWSRLGVTLNNCLPQNFGGKFVWQNDNEVEGIPMAVRVGGVFNLFGKEGWRKNEDQTLNLLLDYENKRETNRPTVWHAGLEYLPLDLLALRVGIDQKPKASEAGVGVDNNLTAGVGLNYFDFTFDYAFHQFGDLSENTTHFFSIGYRGIDREQRQKKTRSPGAIPLSVVVSKPALKVFTDVQEKYWARKPIEYLATLQIMGGYPDNTFHPDQPVSRQELAAILVKAKGFEVKKVSRSPFRDVSYKDGFAPFIDLAVKRQYINGYPDGTFRPRRKVTRGEASIIFAKFAGLYQKPKVSEQVFPDVAKVHWASPAIAAAKEAGFFEYLAGKKFGVGEYLTRAEVAEILSKTSLVKEKIKKLISGEE